jgi:hypothetical protein
VEDLSAHRNRRRHADGRVRRAEVQAERLVLSRLVFRWAARSREGTGIGFVTEIAVPDGTPRPEGNPNFKLGDVFGTTDGLEDGFGLLLHVSDGVIQSLEGYAFEDHWPAELQNVTFRYADPGGRDFEKLKKLIHEPG